MEILQTHNRADRFVLASLAEVARQILAGKSAQVCLKECVDAWNSSRSGAFFEEPPPLLASKGLGQMDAWMGGAAEHMAQCILLPAPGWSEDGGRFLETPWFVAEGIRGQRLALIETPCAFRRRLVFCGKTSLR